MDEALAARIMRGALSMDKVFGELDDAIRTIPDETERKKLLEGLAKLMFDVNDTIIRPIARQHPKLDPNPL
jgi:hypothetical protein